MKASLRVQHARNADERRSTGTALSKSVWVTEKKRSAKVVDIRHLADQLDIDAVITAWQAVFPVLKSLDDFR